MEANKHRAGRYVKQPSGYRAFIPSSFPPDPPIRISGKILPLLSEADQAIARLDGATLTLPDPDFFVFSYLRREAVLSSQIEGTQSSLQDVLAAEAEVMRHKLPQDVEEVINYVKAIKHGLTLLDSLPVSLRLIREVHTKLLHGVRGAAKLPGEIRTSQNWIGSGGNLRDAIYVPPPPHEVPEALSQLEKFIHNPGNLPKLVWIGIVHVQFETIHPFLDGNGRVGRLLIILLLCQQEVLSQPLLYLSHYFKQHRQEYYERLQSVRDEGAWEEWLIFFLRGVASVSKEAFDTGKKLLVLRDEHRRLVSRDFAGLASNGLRVLEELYTRPIVQVKNIQAWLGTAYPAANNLVTRLVDCGILTELTGQSRNRVFSYQSYLDLFQDT